MTLTRQSTGAASSSRRCWRCRCCCSARERSSDPGDLTSLDRGDPARRRAAAVGAVARSARGIAGVAGALRRADARRAARTRRSATRTRSCAPSWRDDARGRARAAELEKLLGLRDVDAGRDARGARDRRRDLAVLPRRARRARPRRGRGQAGHAGAAAGRRRRPRAARLRPLLRRLLPSIRESAIDVVVPRTGGRGIAQGHAPARTRYRCASSTSRARTRSAEGDAVVTSGLGGVFPRDLPVGKIVKVDHGAASACTRRSRSSPSSTSAAARGAGRGRAAAAAGRPDAGARSAPDADAVSAAARGRR